MEKRWQIAPGRGEYVVRIDERVTPYSLDERAFVFLRYALLCRCTYLTLRAKNLVRRYIVERSPSGESRCTPLAIEIDGTTAGMMR